ncbi:rhomboid family intramembrane serine protease [candidate division KSB1 bacterium]|nr:MAG: rhomboid family intramembrane serine protease [candidate division KSB1 bacterium]
MYYQYNRVKIGFGSYLTPAVKKLILINVGVFIFQVFSTVNLNPVFGLVPKFIYTRFWIWQLFTYMFLHGGFFHLFWNMFGLWMFGCEIERYWGSKEFLKYYIITGMGAGIFNFIFTPTSYIPIIGASGAIFGILTAFGLLFPDRLIFLYFLFPIKAKYFVLFFGAITFFSAFSHTGDGIAHFAHLGGMVVGYLYLKSDWRLYRIKKYFENRKKKKNLKVYWNKKRKEEEFKGRVDAILDKINEVGYDNLTDEEKKILRRASNFFSDDEEE